MAKKLRVILREARENEYHRTWVAKALGHDTDPEIQGNKDKAKSYVDSIVDAAHAANPEFSPHVKKLNTPKPKPKKKVDTQLNE